MTRVIKRLTDIAAQYDAIVFDQWGVLHNGTKAYPDAATCLTSLRTAGQQLAVLSNSGKRAAPNRIRIASMGFDPDCFHVVMTSGEALWVEITAGQVSAKQFFAIERDAGDASAWAEELPITLTPDLRQADAVLLMGLPDGTQLSGWQGFMDDALSLRLPIYCTNPDRASPRAGGLVMSPGTLAFAYAAQGGQVRFYGKPHRPVFDALANRLEGRRFLMVGDSLEHDIAGAQAAGWDTLLIQGGLYAAQFATGDPEKTLSQLVADKGTAPPTYRMDLLA